MKKTSAISLLAILAFSALLPMFVAPAFASSPCGTVNSANPPAGYSLVVNVQQMVVNDVDSGNTALWALDAFVVNIQVYQSGTDYYVVGLYSGTSFIPAGAPSPGAGITEPYSGTAQMSGGFTSTFSGTYSLPSQTTGTLRTIDANGTVADVLANTYPPTSPLAGLLRLGSLGQAAFNAMNPWGWFYSYGSQSWCDSTSVISGDIVTTAPMVPPIYSNPEFQCRTYPIYDYFVTVNGVQIVMGTGTSPTYQGPTLYATQADFLANNPLTVSVVFDLGLTCPGYGPK